MTVSDTSFDDEMQRIMQRARELARELAKTDERSEVLSWLEEYRTLMARKSENLTPADSLAMLSVDRNEES